MKRMAMHEMVRLGQPRTPYRFKRICRRVDFGLLVFPLGSTRVDSRRQLLTGNLTTLPGFGQ
jgi:hypothetical protein